MRAQLEKRHGLLAVAGLLALVAAAAAWTLVFAAKVTEPFVWPDELTYAKQAVRIWDLHRFLLPSDADFNSWAQLQPLVMAPFWGTMSSQGAYHAVHVVNSLLLASTAVPAYLLARRVTGQTWLALAVAALSVVTPWMTLAGTMMTEVIGYPVFAWTLLAMQRALAQPGLRGDLIALVALAVAFAARAQFIALAPALLLALAVQELRFGGLPLRGLVRRHALLLAAVALALLVLLVSGTNSRGLFGAYSQSSQGGLLPEGTVTQALELLAYLAVATAVLPLALSLAFALGQLARPSDRERHAFALVLLAVTICLLYVTGVFSAQFTAGIQDRYVYFLAVPFFVGSAAWVVSRPGAWLPLAAGAVFAAWIVWRSALDLRSPSLVSPSAAWHKVLFGRVIELNDKLGVQWPTVQRLAGLATIAACVVLLVAARRLRRPLLLPAVLLGGLGLYAVVETQYTMNQIAAHEEKRDELSWNRLDWIDDRLPADADAPALLSDMGSANDAMAIWWHVQFWNKGVVPAYTFDGKNLAQSFPRSAKLDAEQGVIPELADKRFAVHALPDRRYQLRGARTLGSQDSVELVSLPGDGRVDWVLDAASENALVPVRRPAKLRVFAPTDGGRQRVQISFTTNFQTASDYRYRITGPDVERRGLVAIGKSRVVTFDARPAQGAYAEFTISATGRVHPDYPLGGLLITDLRSTPLP